MTEAQLFCRLLMQQWKNNEVQLERSLNEPSKIQVWLSCTPGIEDIQTCGIHIILL